ncbi:unnamed protein product [Ectocarpus sp. 13 AM-2016]
MCMLEQKCGRMEILRFLMFRLNFNDYYKERRSALMLPPPPPSRGCSSATLEAPEPAIAACCLGYK